MRLRGRHGGGRGHRRLRHAQEGRERGGGAAARRASRWGTTTRAAGAGARAGAGGVRHGPHARPVRDQRVRHGDRLPGRASDRPLPGAGQPSRRTPEAGAPGAMGSGALPAALRPGRSGDAQRRLHELEGGLRGDPPVPRRGARGGDGVRVRDELAGSGVLCAHFTGSDEHARRAPGCDGCVAPEQVRAQVAPRSGAGGGAAGGGGPADHRRRGRRAGARRGQGEPWRGRCAAAARRR